MRTLLLPLLLALSLAATGCAGGLVALQAAGYAKTAYDYHEVVMPENRVGYSERSLDDRGVENRVRERLERQGLTRVAAIDATAISGHLYLVGAFADKPTAQRAREVAKATPGVRQLTCSFLLTDPAGADTEASREAARSIRTRLTRFDKPFADVRVSVLEDNAVLMGFVPTSDDKREAEALALATNGVRTVRSYIDVRTGR